MNILVLQAPQGGSPLLFPITMALMFGVIYFFMIRPQQKLKDKQKTFSETLKKGDKVVTIGGLHGVIVELDGTTATLLVDQKVRMQYQREAISYETTNAAYPKTTGAEPKS